MMQFKTEHRVKLEFNDAIAVFKWLDNNLHKSKWNFESDDNTGSITYYFHSKEDLARFILTCL